MSPGIDYPAWKFWFDVVQYLITIIVAVYVWTSNRAHARKKDMDSVKEVVVGIGTRVTKLETGAISKDDLAAVYNRVNAISDQVSNLSGKMDGIGKSVDMIQEYLLNNGGKK